MRTQGAIDVARASIVDAIAKTKIALGKRKLSELQIKRHELQLACLQGMSVALQWASESGGNSLQRLIDGEELDV